MRKELREFTSRVMVAKKDGTGWEMEIVTVQARDAQHARGLVAHLMTDKHGSAYWRWL